MGHVDNHSPGNEQLSVRRSVVLDNGKLFEPAGHALGGINMTNDYIYLVTFVLLFWAGFKLVILGVFYHGLILDYLPPIFVVIAGSVICGFSLGKLKLRFKGKGW